ncbi:MAG TPA: UbiD family decarboxylase [Archaeoglobaceae archaeon]|nr:UbiD family decarboxylase [Archaeoglobaceae archaeon]
MNLRDAISSINKTEINKELKHNEVMDFVRKNGYDYTPLLLNVEGKKVAMNFIATREILCRYLRIEKENLAKYLANLPYDGEISILDNNLEKCSPDLGRIPVLKFFERDGGKYITAGVVIARNKDSEVENPESYNACIHRLMVLDEKRLVARLVAPRHTYLLWKKAMESGKDLPVAIAIGVHPLFLFAASTRVPKGKEFGYAASLMKGLDLYRIDDILVPDSEYVLIGRMTHELIREGPFVDITGTYDTIREQPVIEIDRMYMKEEPVYYSITPAGGDHQVLMGIPYESEIFRAVKKVCDVRNVVMTEGGKHYFHAVVQMRKNREGEGKNAIIAAFSAHQSLKHVTVVDEDIDIYNINDVEYAIATRFQADRDLVLIKNVRGSTLDPSSDDGITTKWGIDATKELSREKNYERVI